MNATKPTLPVLSVLFAATLWGCMWYPLRLLQAHGMYGLWTTLVSYTTALAVGFIPLWRRREELASCRWGLLVLALAAGWCNVAFILAVIAGDVVRVMLLFYLSPLWTVLLGRIILRERLSASAWWVFLAALAGAAIMLWNPALGMPLPRGGAEWLAVSAGFAFAVNNVVVRDLQQVSVTVKAVVTWLGVAVVAGAWLLLGHGHWPVTDAAGWAGAVALGLAGIVVMTVALLYGVTHMPAHRSAVILLFELVAGAVSAQLLTTETIGAKEWAGGALIMGAAFLAARMQTEQ